MTEDVADSGVAAEELKQFVERIERLDQERQSFVDDVKAVRKVLALRKLDRAERMEMDAILELYMNALGMS